MQGIVKVYLDTNIIILGPKSKENHELIELLKKGKIKLFVSEKLTMERRERSFKQQDKIDKLIRQEKSLGERTFFKLHNEAIKERERLKNLEKEELKFWMQVKPENVKSTFRGLTLIGLFGPELIELLDTKNERMLLGELLTIYNLSNSDAFHIMEAHSAEMDYFLTWDDRLIKKANHVSWLGLVVMRPSEFLGKIRANDILI